MYSEKLIKEVKKIYPDNKEMHRLADQGSAMLGRYLYDNCGGGLSLSVVLTALSLEDCQAKARLEQRKLNCYAMWCDEDPRKQKML